MKKIYIFIAILDSFFVAWSLLIAGSFSNGSIFTLVFMLGGFALSILCRRYRIKNRRVSVVSAILGGLFSFLLILRNFEIYSEGLSNPLFKLIVNLSVFVGFFILFGKLLTLLYSSILRRSELNVIEETAYRGFAGFLYSKLFVISTILCFVCYIPFFLYLYPGVMTADSIVQLEQALGEASYSNHHPWLHTLVIQACVQFGLTTTDNLYTSIAIFTVLQMIVMSLVCGYAVDTIKLVSRRLWVPITALIIYALVPINSAYSVTMWKDVPFGLSVLLLICTLTRLFCLNEYNSIREYILFAFAGVGVCLLRTNGWYGFLASLPFVLVLSRRKKLPVWPILAGVILLSWTFKGPAMKLFEVEQPDFVESVAVPSQMVAQVLVNERELTPAQQELINNTIDTTYIKELYIPGHADSIKELIRANHPEYLASHKGDFLRLFVELGLEYPADYLKAFVDQTYSIWYPEVFYSVSELEGIAPNPWGLYHYPLIRGPVVTKAHEIWVKLGTIIPGYGLLWSMGTLTWISIIGFGATLVASKGTLLRRAWCIFVPVLMLLATLVIAIPIMKDYRYVYFSLLSLPLYLSVMSVRRN